MAIGEARPVFDMTGQPRETTERIKNLENRVANLEGSLEDLQGRLDNAWEALADLLDKHGEP